MEDDVTRPRLTDADYLTIRRALNDAMDDRASFADAWEKGAPERKMAMALVERYEKLHRKMFGEDSSRQRQADELDVAPMVSIFEIGSRP